jgi:FixJ family two-component response regulator
MCGISRVAIARLLQRHRSTIGREVRRNVDVHMPGVSGFDVQSKLRATQIEIPVVLITASDDPVLAQTALTAGGVRLLRKPFSSADLLEGVSAALRIGGTT